MRIYGGITDIMQYRFSDNRKISLPVMHTLSNITYVEAGSLTSFVVQGLMVYMPGDNSYGQLRNGTKIH